MTRLLPILLLCSLCASCKTEQQQVKIQRAPVPVSLADIPQRSVAKIVHSPLPPLTFTWEYHSNIGDVAYFQFYEVTNLATGGRRKSFQVPAPALSLTIPNTNSAGFFVLTTVGIDGSESAPNTK